MTQPQILSAPLALSVRTTTAAPVATRFTPPYALPAPGTKVDIPIAGRNVAIDVRPAPHTPGSWAYALFRSYGGGSFSADYSAAGAYVLAGMGGHNAPPCFGAAIFDFTDGRWSYLPNGNGFNEARVNDVDRSETNGSPYLELTAVARGQMPSPSHHYTLQVSPPKSVVGGPRGAVVVTLGAAKMLNGYDSPQPHLFDLATGLWTRASDNLATDVGARTPFTNDSAAYDPATKRVYVTLNFGTEDRVTYLDLVDRKWKTSPRYPLPNVNAIARSIFVDNRRRLLLYVLNNGQFWGLNLNDPASGPRPLKTSGTVPNTSRRWDEYPLADGGDGCFYTFTGLGPAYTGGSAPLATSQALLKIAPPANGNPLTGTWAFSTVPIRGGLTAQYVTDAGSGAHHESRFFYVPSIACFAWIPNGIGPVELIRP